MSDSPAEVVLPRERFDDLFRALAAAGYEVIGPRVREGAIVYDSVSSSTDLPVGWRDELAPGKYRIAKTESPSLFDFNVGPTSWKKFLFPPQRRLWSATRSKDGFSVVQGNEQPRRLAFLGVRGCEVAAIGVQDRVFRDGNFRDDHYSAQRHEIFIIGVNCLRAGGTCFCSSMGTGPEVRSGYDLRITEIVPSRNSNAEILHHAPDDAKNARGSSGFRHEFIIRAGSERGRSLLRDLGDLPLPSAEAKSAEAAGLATANREMGRQMDTADLPGLLRRSSDSSHWDAVASRCLSCANCTMACPTCFCSTVEEVNDITGDHTERWQRWDSCFNLDHSYLHGGSVRNTGASRYRQWLTHKLGTWFDQFGQSGCVGCGRCIAWCPVGIDLTEEVAALRQLDGTKSSADRSEGKG